MTLPKRTPAIIAALLAILIVAVWAAWRSPTPNANPPPAVAASAGTDTPVPATTTGTAAPRIELPVYTPVTTGLPPADLPLRDSYSALRDAAARGNATAACRLAFTAMDCWPHRRFGDRVADMEAQAAEGDQRVGDMLARLAARRINDAPEPYRDYIGARVEAAELARATHGDLLRERARRCEGAPEIDVGEAAHLLRQAALAGQPDAVVAYANGAWLMTLAALHAARGPSDPPMLPEAYRDPSFQAWRREAAAVHQAGLEAGLLPVLESEAMRNRMTLLDQLVQRDPVQQAAALRTLAGLVGIGAPPSTSTLGLDAASAAEADRRAERWMASARDRARASGRVQTFDHAIAQLGGLPTCE